MIGALVIHNINDSVKELENANQPKSSNLEAEKNI